MSLKKKAEVRTGKMVRELMLADKDVTASLIMVYSNNGVNEEIKIEGLNPKSNEELFLSGNVDWNQSVIYKTVDFAGKAEVGKVTVVDMKKNNVTLQIERVMWSKDKQGEEITPSIPEELPEPEKEESSLEFVHTDEPEQKEITEPVTLQAILKAQADVESSAIQTETQSPPITIKPKEAQHAETALPTPTTEHDSALQEQYNHLVANAIRLCQDYELGMDIDDSIEALKTELQTQGFTITADPDILNTINQLRSLKAKGIDLEKVLNLV